MPVQENRSELRDFPLFEGGPHYLALDRAGLGASGRAGTLPIALVATLVTWAPLALLAAAQGLFTRSSSALPFVSDIALHLKLLLALPAFILSDRIVRRPLLAVLRRFLDHELVAGGDRERFLGLVASALRLRDSRVSSLVILVLACCGSLLLVRVVLFDAGPNWHFVGSGGARRLSWAGWWHGLVSYPAYLFILLRFFYRLLLWWRLLGQVARMPLQFQPAHPDGAGGLIFLGASLSAFTLPAFALSAALSSGTAALMLMTGASLVEHKNGIIGIAAFIAVLFVAPLLFFVAPLARARARALRSYDALASVRLAALERCRAAQPPAALDGAPADDPGLSEVSDLNAVGVAIRSMRPLPLERADLAKLLIAILLPFLAVLSTAIPIGELLKKLIGLFA